MLILVRHGESVWNASDRFAGGVDVALTERGRREAAAAGRWLAERGIRPTVAHSSMLRRASNTADLMLDACHLSDVHVAHLEVLNERHYGALQGVARSAAVARYGADQVHRWRRTMSARPPLDAHGRGESLGDLKDRLRPYASDVLMPAVADGHVVLVVSHGNTIRMMSQLLGGLTDEEACALPVPTGVPYVSSVRDAQLLQCWSARQPGLLDREFHESVADGRAELR